MSTELPQDVLALVEAGNNRLRADEGAVCESYRAELASLREKLVDETAQRQGVLDGLTRAITAEGAANKAYYGACAERDALRKRLAKLEMLARRALEVMFVPDKKSDCVCAECALRNDLAAALALPA